MLLVVPKAGPIGSFIIKSRFSEEMRVILSYENSSRQHASTISMLILFCILKKALILLRHALIVQVYL